MNVAAIETLANIPQWVGWKHEPDEKGKTTKVLKSARANRNASSTNPQTWSDYETAVKSVEKFGYDGYGWVFTEDVGIVGIDLDKCIDDSGVVEPWAMKIINAIDSYTEISPSGQGLHIFAYGALPKGMGQAADSRVEMYPKGRYFTVTEDHLPGTSDTINHRGNAVMKLYQAEKEKRGAKTEPPKKATTVTTSDNGRSPYVEAGIQNELGELATATDGHRNSTLNKVAFSLGQFVGAGHLTEAETESMLRDTALAIGLGERETEKTIRSGLTKGIATPRTNWPELNGNGAAHVSIDANGKPPTGEAYEALKAEAIETPRHQIFTGMSLDDLRDMPPKQWLVEGVIGEGDIGMIFGEEGTGKTFALVDWIFAMAMGLKCSATFDTVRPLKIAYCTGEGRGGIPQRFNTMRERYRADEDQNAAENIRIFLDMPQLFNDESEKYIDQFIDDYRAQYGDDLDILILDTLHNAALGSNENDQKDAGQVISATRKARDELGCAVILAHHANKAAGGYRGSSAYAADMDVMLEICGKANPRTLKCYKAKDADRFEPITFRLEPLADSVYPYWVTEKDAGNELDYSNEDYDVLVYMNQYQNDWLTIEDICYGLNRDYNQTNRNYVRRTIEKLEKHPGYAIEQSQKNADKKVSRSNPYVWRVASANQQIATV